MDFKKLSDFTLMEKIKAGEEKAFLVLVQRYQKPLYNFFWYMGISEEECEDMVQEVFLKLFSYRFQYRPVAKFSTFLYTLGRCTWIDWVRKEKIRAGTLENIDSIQNNCSSIDNSIDIQHALQQLSEKLRTVVVMSVYQGLKHKEIAGILNIPVGTVKSRMNLAINKLKLILNGEEDGSRA